MRRPEDLIGWGVSAGLGLIAFSTLGTIAVLISYGMLRLTGVLP